MTSNTSGRNLLAAAIVCLPFAIAIPTMGFLPAVLAWILGLISFVPISLTQLLVWGVAGGTTIYIVRKAIKRESRAATLIFGLSIPAIYCFRETAYNAAWARSIDFDCLPEKDAICEPLTYAMQLQMNVGGLAIAFAATILGLLAYWMREARVLRWSVVFSALFSLPLTASAVVKLIPLP